MTTLTAYLSERGPNATWLSAEDLASLDKAKLVPPGTQGVVRVPIFEVATGHFNETPFQLEEVTAIQYGRLLFGSVLRAKEFRQAPIPGGGNGHASMLLYHMTGGYGLAMVEGDSSAPGLRYFKFGYKTACQHDYATVATGNCYHEAKCRKCGHVAVHDSSD